MNAWINGTSPAVNVRSTPGGAVVRTIDDKGELVRRGGAQGVGTYHWYEYTFLNGVKGWIRDDVHEAEALRASVLLDVPYKKQFGDSTNDDRNNDCAAACIAMLLGFEGVNITVDEVTAVINQPEGLVHFRHLIPAIEKLGFKSEVRQGQRLSNILRSLNDGRPMMTLVNYAWLRGSEDYQYGHFVVPIGYELVGNLLTLIVHDPYNKASMRFHAGQFAKAIAEMEGTNNTAFQTLYFTGRINPPVPDDPPPGVHLATIRQHAVTMRDAANDIIRIIDTIAG